MSGDELTVYEGWDLARPTLPPRSRLFSLDPIGIGTSETESLTSYITRLAEAHGVLVRPLVVQEILPLLDRPHWVQTQDHRLPPTFWWNETRAFNGTRPLAQQLAAALHTLTGQPTLRFLTLLTWAEVLSVRQLQRPTRAWCPACYEEQRQAGQVIYEPLLWSLAPVILCLRHHQRLQFVCPYSDCRRPSPWLGPRSRPGYCARCERWLGRPSIPEPAEAGAATPEEDEAHLWIAQALGDLIAAAPTLPTPPRREHLLQALAASVERVAQGNRRAWARTLGLVIETAAQWHTGLTLPSLSFLLLICSRLGTTPLRFLLGDDAHVPHRAEAHRAPRLPAPPPHAWPTLERETTQRVLGEILAGEEEPPPSLQAVARRLAVSNQLLRYYFPDECRAISARHLAYRKERGRRTRERLREEVRQATYQLHHQGQYPSSNRVALLLNRPATFRIAAAQAAWHEALQELGWRT
ncbi:TniQ family protein [Sinomonas sp.]|uniref:TniQ family protein n=1 Tax=Sinomonas sp. TaxID=1914986 RepID=UPI002FDFE263